MEQNNTAVPAPRVTRSTIEMTDEDLALLSPKEEAVERKAVEEELKKRSWMADPVHSVARRVPVSVFALGDLAQQG